MNKIGARAEGNKLQVWYWYSGCWQTIATANNPQTAATLAELLNLVPDPWDSLFGVEESEDPSKL